MEYFTDVQMDDQVFSLVYGDGQVIYVLETELRLPGSFAFQVQYKNEKVYYNEEGIPGWCKMGDCKQTVYYLNDLTTPKLDYDRIDKDILSLKKIAKLRLKKTLEMRCPSGAWRNVAVCPENEFLKAIQDEEYYLFRKAENE